MAAIQQFCKKFLPFIVFPLLSGFAFHYEYLHFLQNDADQQLHATCQSRTTSPYHRSYTGLDSIDEGVCVLIAFFHVVMDASPSLPIVTYLFGTSLPFVIFTLVEARRVAQHRFLTHPFLWLFLTQCATFGLVYPIYALLLVATGSMTAARPSEVVPFSKHRATSLVSAIVLGAVMPSTIMVISNHPIATWTWQFYPLFVFVVERISLRLLPKKWSLVSGHVEMKIFYQLTFIFSASMHLLILSRLWRNDIPIGLILVPKITPPNPSSGLSIQLLHFFKWDLAMSATSLIFATLWSTSSPGQTFALVAWYAIAVPALGPGAAFMAVIYWRDILNHGYIKGNSVKGD